MLPPHEQFSANIAQVKALVGVASAIDRKTTSAIEVNDIYRAALVLGVGAIDHYVHEKTLAGMLEIANATRAPTNAFGRFRVPLSALGTDFEAPVMAWFEKEVRAAHSAATFQRADAIADAIRLFHPDPIWPAVAEAMGKDTQEVKNTLDLIVERRNKIAHEADCEPSGLGIRWPISENMVGTSLSFLVSVVDAIESIV